MFVKTLQLQLSKIKDNKMVLLLLIILSAVLIWLGNKQEPGRGQNNVTQAVAYLFAMWFCSYCIDLITTMKRVKGEFTVRKPLLESVIATLCSLLGTFFLVLRFSGKVQWEKVPNITRLSIAAGIFLFVFPIALAIIMLLMKYRPRDLGIRLQGFVPGIAVLAITAVTSYFAAPGRFTLQIVLKEGGGIAGALFIGFVTAALSEEFFRMVLQTRFVALFRNTGAGWMVASLIWALMHGPKWYGESKNISDTLLSCLRIVPLGLMWGYLTHRTRSILPSILCHGMNIWGLQNF
jgi:membrane protease YdiL (CAAX protease family)